MSIHKRKSARDKAAQRKRKASQHVPGPTLLNSMNLLLYIFFPFPIVTSGFQRSWCYVYITHIRTKVTEVERGEGNALINRACTEGGDSRSFLFSSCVCSFHDLYQIIHGTVMFPAMFTLDSLCCFFLVCKPYGHFKSMQRGIQC